MGNQNEKLGNIVKEARVRAGIKQAELADRLHISRRYLIDIEHDRHKPSYRLFCLLISELDLQTEAIFRSNMMIIEKEIKELTNLLHYLNEVEIASFSAALHTLVKLKKNEACSECTRSRKECEPQMFLPDFFQ